MADIHIDIPLRYLNIVGDERVAYRYDEVNSNDNDSDNDSDNDNDSDSETSSLSTVVVLILNGFASAMDESNKAKTIAKHCHQHNLASCRMDYRGHGESSPSYQDYVLSDWIQDVRLIIDQVIFNNQSNKVKTLIIVASSMGVWIAMILLKQYQQHQQHNQPIIIHAVLGIAAGPNFLLDIYNNQLSQSQHQQLEKEQHVQLTSRYKMLQYSITYTKRIFQDAKRWELDFKTSLRHKDDHDNQVNVLSSSSSSNDGCVDNKIKVHLFHGMCDTDIPHQKSLQLADALNHSNGSISNATAIAKVTLIPDGDHRLSKPHHSKQILLALDTMIHDATTSTNTTGTSFS